MHLITRLSLVAATALAISSCIQTQPSAPSSEEHALKVILQHPQGSFENFVTQANYPSSPRVYFNHSLMRKAGSSSPIYISQQQQRARLYVNGKVAADWPVSTGTYSHPTPNGTFSVLEKKSDHASSLYGRIVNSSGKTVKSNADSRKDKIPAGGKFIGAPMPYWQRLTWDGVGLHVGRVVPGRRLSHGCIRMPRVAASKMYGITDIGRTKVHIRHGVESQFPDSARTAMNAEKILKNYRDYAKKQGVPEKKLKISETFKLSQKALAAQLPSLESVKHVDVQGVSLLDPEHKRTTSAKKN